MNHSHKEKKRRKRVAKPFTIGMLNALYRADDRLMELLAENGKITKKIMLARAAVDACVRVIEVNSSRRSYQPN